jgi:hypothetical protein
MGINAKSGKEPSPLDTPRRYLQTSTIMSVNTTVGCMGFMLVDQSGCHFNGLLEPVVVMLLSRSTIIPVCCQASQVL